MPIGPDRIAGGLLVLLFGAGGAALTGEARAQSAAEPPRVGTADLLSPTPVAAEPVWGAAVFLGASGGGADLHVLAYKPWHIDPSDHVFAGTAVSRRLARFWTDFTVEAEVGAGQRVGNRYHASEAWVAGYLRYDGFPWNRFVKTSVAFSTGLNIIDNLPSEETRRADKHHSHLLHYFSPEVTFALPEAPNHELVVRFQHRSGVFGTFNGVWGGSNVVAVGYRYRW
ncbi:hypothetical protein [Prosthecomicrobium sp. N25]|uniref:hypothetical protein n=1 Tax=Prosthecomicrobium sp. N25 TaxID=3129254 RepID=UPI0030777E63